MTTKIVSQASPEEGPERAQTLGRLIARWVLTWAFVGGRYWDRTSDPFGVNEVLSR